jgi:peptidyl-prolyl cis-trans isomerase SurA
MRRLDYITASACAGAMICIVTLGFGAPALGQTDMATPSAADLTPSTTAATSGATSPNGLSESVVVTVNDEMISSFDVVQRMRLLIVTAGIQPSPENLPDIQREAVRSLIDERLEMQELRHQAKEQKFDLIASDAEVNGELADIARGNNTSADQLLNQLAAQGVGAQTFRDQLRAEISWRGWIRGRYGQRLTVGEDQVKAFQKHLEAEADKPQYQISEVFVDAARAGGIAAAQQGATQLLGQLQKGAPFAAVARQFSNTPSAANGGDVGWISPGEMPPEVDRALENLRPGQLSGAITVKDGVYIIYLKDKRAGGASTMVTLKQVAISLPKGANETQIAAANAKLLELRPKLSGCDNLEAQAAKVPGAVSGDLGEAETKDLAPAFRDAADALKVGEVSAPIRTEVGLHLIAVCGRRHGGASAMTSEQIENRLYGQELSMIAKRQLRDLRNSATIETR